MFEKAKWIWCESAENPDTYAEFVVSGEFLEKEDVMDLGAKTAGYLDFALCLLKKDGGNDPGMLPMCRKDHECLSETDRTQWTGVIGN